MILPIHYSNDEKELIRHFIQRGDVPGHLYKYRTIDRVKQLLESHSIYFSSCEQLNDPFESAINLLTDYTPKQYYDSFIFAGFSSQLAKELTRQVFDGTIDGDAIIKELTKGVISSVGYFCMTSSPDNLLMWAHYADSHRGVCLKFEILKDLDSFLVPVKVDYNSQYINFDCLSSNLLDVLRRKSPDWEYEDEYRVIKTDHQGLWKIKQDCLVEIIFGCRTSKEDKESIKSLASTSGFTNITYFEAREKKDSYGLDICEI
jgi:hypothetical protein